MSLSLPSSRFFIQSGRFSHGVALIKFHPFFPPCPHFKNHNFFSVSTINPHIRFSLAVALSAPLPPPFPLSGPPSREVTLLTGQNRMSDSSASAVIILFSRSLLHLRERLQFNLIKKFLLSRYVKEVSSPLPVSG